MYVTTSRPLLALANLDRNYRHNWGDPDALRILRPLREACAPESKLLLVDNLMSFACPASPGDATASLVGRPPVPEPLLNNLGVEMGYLLDIAMMGLVNGVERTIQQWQSLIAEAGFKIDKWVTYSPSIGTGN